MSLGSRLRWVLLAWLGLLLCGAALLHTGPARRFVAAYLAEALRRQGIRFSVASLDYNLLAGSVDARGVVIAVAGRQDLPPLFQAEAVRARAERSALLRGRLEIAELRLERPQIRMVVDEQGRDNLPAGSGDGGNADAIVHHLKATGGSFAYEDRRQGYRVDAPDWSATMEGDGAGGHHRIRLATRSQVRLSVGQKHAHITRVEAQALLERKAIALESLRVVAPEWDLSGSGRIANLDKPELDLKFAVSSGLGWLASTFNLPVSLAGQIALQARLSGPAHAPRILAVVDGRNLKADRFEDIALLARLDYAAAEEVLAVRDLAIQSPLLQASAQADISLRAGRRSEAKVRIDRTDLNQLVKHFAWPVRVSATASGVAVARWPALQLDAAVLDAAITLAPASGLGLPLEGALRVSGKLPSVAVRVDALKSQALRLHGEAQLETSAALRGAFQLEAGDVAAVAGEWRQLLSQAVEALPVRGPARAHVTLGGTLQAPEAILDLAAGPLDWQRGWDVRAEAKAKLTPNALVIESARLRWAGQSLSATGSIGFEDPGKLDLALEAKQVSLEAVLEALGYKDLEAAGVVNLSAHLLGSAANPEAELKVQASALTAYREPLGALEAEARLRSRRLAVPRLILVKQDGSLEFSGSLALDTGDYELKAQGSRLAFSQLELPGGWPLRGTLAFDLSGRGNRQEPALEAQVRFMDLVVGSEKAGDLKARIEIFSGAAKVDAQLLSFNTGLEVTAGIRAPYPAEVRLQVKEAALERMPFLKENRIAGLVTASLQARGELANWKKSQVEAEIAPLKWMLAGQPLTSDGPVLLAYNDGDVAVAPVTVRLADSRARLAGRFPLMPERAPGKLRLDGELRLDDLRPLVGESLPAWIAGRLLFDTTVSGSPRLLKPGGDLRFEEIKINLPWAEGELRGSARLQEGRLIVDAIEGGLAGASIRAGGELPLALLAHQLPVPIAGAQGEAVLNAEINIVEMNKLRGVPQALSATASARVHARAPRLDLGAIQGSISFPTLRLSYLKFQAEQQEPSEIVFSDGVASVKRFALVGPATMLRLSGTAEFSGVQRLNLETQGELDVSLVELLGVGLSGAGPASFAFNVRGTAQAPSVSGFLQLQRGRLVYAAQKLEAQDLEMRVEIADNRLSVKTLEGALNGGRLRAQGAAVLERGGVAGAEIGVELQGGYFEAFSGLRALANADLRIEKQPDGWLVAGEILVPESSFRQPVSIDPRLFQAREAEPLIATAAPSEPLRFDVAIRTSGPLVLDNNLAKAILSADLRLRGSASRPGLTGRVDIEEGAELFIGSRTFALERGTITFLSEERIQAVLDLTARTRVGQYEINLRAQGEPGRQLETALTSDPPRPERDVLAILATGREPGEVAGAELEIGQREAASFLASALGGSFAQQAGRAVGLSEIRIGQSLIANETEPTSRLTLGQNITSRLGLIYSMNLRDSRDQIWIGKYDVTRRFTTRAIRQADNTYRFQFQHDLKFGGPPEGSGKASVMRGAKPRVIAVAVEGNTAFATGRILGWLGVQPGDSYDFFRLRGGVERIEKAYAEAGYAEARISLEKVERDSGIGVTVRIVEGHRIAFAYQGWSPARTLRKRVASLWRQGGFEADRLRRTESALRDALIGRGHLEAQVRANAVLSGADKRIVFSIRPGMRFSRPRIRFPGARQIGEKTLLKLLKTRQLESALATDPARVIQAIEAFYHKRGWLDAKAAAPALQLDLQKRSAVFSIAVVEGKAYRMGKAAFTGNQAFTGETLERALPYRAGAPFQSQMRIEAVRAVEELYRGHGYAQVRVRLEEIKDPEAAEVRYRFHVEENQRLVVEEVAVEGAHYTTPNLVRTELRLKKGDVVDPAKLSAARRNLYATGAYAMVDVDVEPLQPTAKAQTAPVRLKARLKEVRPFELEYGGFYDTDRGAGGILDFSNRNMLGGARLIGLRARYDSDLREARAYFSQPFLYRLPVSTLATSFVRRELQREFITDRVGLSLNAETRFGKHYRLNAGYRFESAHTFETEPDPLFPFDVRLRLAPLTAALSRDSRDDVLDASRGSFISHALEWAPERLGSQLRFFKYFGQYFRYQPLSAPALIPWVGQTRPRWIYAAAVRLGLGGGLGGQLLVQSERFFAGGGTTVRGFGQDALGPLDFRGRPLGGDAVFVTNHELRFPVYGFIDGVGFIDAGNVYGKLRDLRLTDLRTAAGFGLRLRTPYLLLRLDYGIKLNRRPQEEFGRLFFSIGQAF